MKSGVEILLHEGTREENALRHPVQIGLKSISPRKKSYKNTVSLNFKLCQLIGNLCVKVNFIDINKSTYSVILEFLHESAVLSGSMGNHSHRKTTERGSEARNAEFGTNMIKLYVYQI